MYRIIAAIVRPILYFFYRIRIAGKEHLKFSGKMVLCTNHQSNMDPVLVHILVKPKVYYMAKEELFRFKPFGWLISALGAFPVERGRGDLGAVKASLAILKEGKVLGLFPEGKRNKANKKGAGGTFLPFQNGATVIALRAKSPVLPICICTYPKMFRRTVISVGPPIDVAAMADENKSHSENVKAITAYLEKTMAELRIKGLREKGGRKYKHL